VRGTMRIPKDAPLEVARAEALRGRNVQAHVEGKAIVREIYVPGKILNLVVRG